MRIALCNIPGQQANILKFPGLNIAGSGCNPSAINNLFINSCSISHYALEDKGMGG